MAFDKNKLGNYGLGLGLRSELRLSTLDFFIGSKDKSGIDSEIIQWLEIVPENYIEIGGKKKREFEEVLKAGIPLIPHGVNLSVGTAPKEAGSNSLDMDLVNFLKDDLFPVVNPPWFSDHISCSRIDDVYVNELLPLPFTNEAVNVVADNVKFLQDTVQLPFLVENPSYYTTLIEPEMREFEFINKILEKADCGMLLDVNNIYVNSVNQKYDSEEFLDNLDLSRVVQVHIAGHFNDYLCTDSGNLLKILDTHGEAIRPEVYDILDSLLKRTHVNAILLERDSNFPSFEAVLDELREIRKIMNKHECCTKEKMTTGVSKGITV